MSNIYVQNNVDSFRVLLRKAAYSFRLRILNSSNKNVQLISQTVFFYQYSSQTKLWYKELFVLNCE